MSQSETVNVACPQCKHEQPFTIWHSVNVTQSPELKQRILDRSLTSFTCAACGCTVSVEQDLIYHDMDRQLMILRHPKGDEPESLMDESFGLLSTLSGNAYAYRVVTTMNELVEKILIWDDGLDDRVVEVFKFVVWQTLDEAQRSDDARLFYSGIAQDEGAEATLELAWVDDDESLSISVPLENEFRRLEKQILDGLPDAATERGKWLRVDRAYAEVIVGEEE